MPDLFKLVLQIAVILAVCRAVGSIFRKIGQPRVVGEERAAGLQVEDDRARPAGAHVPRVQGSRKVRLERAARPRLCGRDEAERDNCHCRCGETERHGLPFFKQDGKRQVGWVARFWKMGRAAHSDSRLAAG